MTWHHQTTISPWLTPHWALLPLILSVQKASRLSVSLIRSRWAGSALSCCDFMLLSTSNDSINSTSKCCAFLLKKIRSYRGRLESFGLHPRVYSWSFDNWKVTFYSFAIGCSCAAPVFDGNCIADDTLFSIMADNTACPTLNPCKYLNLIRCFLCHHDLINSVGDLRGDEVRHHFFDSKMTNMHPP